MASEQGAAVSEARVLSGRWPASLRGGVAVLAAFAALFLFVPGAVVDPFLAAEAYPALRGETGALYDAALRDGRWLVVAWASALDGVGAGGGQLLFLVLWAVASGAVATAIFDEDPAPWRASLLAVAIASAPPVAELALRGPLEAVRMALIAGFAVLVIGAPRRRAQVLLFLAAPLALMAGGYTPLTLLAVLLASGRGGEDGSALMRAGLTLVAGVALGVLLVFALNVAMHGRLGAMEAAAATGAGLDAFELWLGRVAARLLGPVPLIGLGLLAGALALLYARRPRRADRLLGGLGVSVLVFGAAALQSGDPPAASEATAIWLLIVAALAWAAREAGREALAAAALVALALSAAVGLSAWRDTLGAKRDYQSASEQLAEEIMAAIPEGVAVGPVAIAGSPSSVAGQGVLDRHDALARRLAHLIGRDVVQCPGGGALCERHRAEHVTMPARPSEGWLRVAEDGALLVRLPDGVFVPAPRR